MLEGTYLERLLRARFPNQRVRVERLALRDAVRVSVEFSDRDLAELWAEDGRKAARAVLAPFEPKPRRVRRLRWGRQGIGFAMIARGSVQ